MHYIHRLLTYYHVIKTFFQMTTPYALIRYDTEKEEPVRDSKGLCIEVPRGKSFSPKADALLCAFRTSCLFLSPAGEAGLFVGKIGHRSPFSGYAKNKQQTEKKKLRDVFVKGDLYFNSGDLIRIDEEGFVFFQDRIGDTFRFVDETNRD